MEVCVDSFESVVNAYEGGASRVELCSSLNEGGLTPSFGLLKRVQAYLANGDGGSEFHVNCMLRCRSGDFHYSDGELETMLEDAKKFIELGVDALVFGALDADGHVDESAAGELLKLIPASSRITTTFHRAFDVCADWSTSYNTLCSLGITKLLTSGQQPSAFQGRHLIGELVKRSSEQQHQPGAVQIIAGAGITSDNLAQILRETCCHEFHASCRVSTESRMRFRRHGVPMGSSAADEFTIKCTDKLRVKQLVDIYNAWKIQQQQQQQQQQQKQV